MGILDDAIREHLDLKRRRGADPTEIERLEHEALGPVRRGPGEAVATDPDLPPDDAAEPDWDDAFGEEEEAAELRETAVDNGEPLSTVSNEPPADAQDPSVFEREAPIGEHEPPAVDESGADSPPAPHPATSAPRPGSLDRETAEFDVEPPARETPGKTDDMLEETPEFLQDAPDHDRLWFEQRPPKDFDFDG